MKKKYISAVGAVIVNKKGLFLVLQKNTHPPFWEFLKGTPEKGETDEEILQREIFEETGIMRYDKSPGFQQTVRYQFQAPDGHFIRTVRYYLVQTDEEPRLSSEHLACRWVTREEAEKLFIHENFRKLARKAEQFLQRNAKTLDDRIVDSSS